MASENSAVLKTVARLVMDYLDEQNLTDAYDTFCETSRHLSDQEYLAYSQGIKSLDAGIGLINIVTEYFQIKDKIRDFIRSCPKTSIVISLIDTTNLQSRLDIIFKVLKENLLKFDHVQEEISRKRRKTENEIFDVSQTNTSTPESVQPFKRRRISCSKQLVANISSNIDKDNNNVLGKKDLKIISSPETSNKEDDVTEEEDESAISPSTSSTKKAPPPELLSETILKKPAFAENLAEIINKTLAEHEKSAEASSSQNLLTQHDVQDILSKTENDFEDILKEVIDKYLVDGPPITNSLTSTPTEINNDAKSKKEEVPLKQRLRPRTIKKVPSTERKKQKVKIISNEAYTGPLPLCLNIPTTSSAMTISPSQNPPIPTNIQTLESQSLVFVPIMSGSSTAFIPLQSFQSTGNIICESNVPITTAAEMPTNVQIILTESNNNNNNSPALPNVLQGNNIVINNNNNDSNNIVQSQSTEKLHKTPKASIQTSFLESKCKSTPRRKAMHVRILDFNQTPKSRLAAIKEFKTPSNSIKVDTPGSAPASIMISQKVKIDKEIIKATQTVENGADKSIEIIDDSSNSNSISNTPKVAKNRRRRKIEIDSKEKNHEESSPKPMTAEEWTKMREQQKSMSVDERMRILFQQNEEKSNLKKRKTPKKKKKEELKKESAKKSKPVNSNVQHGKTKFCAKFKVTSPRKAALLRKTPKKKKFPSSSNIVSIEDKENKKTELVQKNETMMKSDDVPKEKEQPFSLPKIISNDSLVEEEKKKDEENLNDSNDLNRSDTVQEVANLLTHLPETILAKTNSGTSIDQSLQKAAIIDPTILMETPLKTDSISPLPNTPRFAVPLISTHQETPMAKEIVAVTTAPSILKVCDILTPSFPITPGFKVTPAKSEASPGGYCSRRTDYSSCSSYYKPDESEDINQNLDSIIKQSLADRSSQSESDGGNLVTTIITTERKEKIRTGSTKKVECPGALERVLSFTEESNANIVPHYNMNEEGLLSESMITTCSDDSSSSFTCSTCSTDPSSDEDTLMKLNKALNWEDRDSEWQCEEELEVETNNSLVDEKTGEVRFPLRNWITPKKIDPQEETKIIIEEMTSEKVLTTICTEVVNVKSAEEQKEEERKQRIANMEAIKKRTINILKKESATITKKPPQKFKKSNVKQFKLPAEQPKSIPLTRRDQILQQSNLTERSKPTALKLIPSTSTTASSSSRRKCLTPRKTIIMDELPKADPTIRKVTNKKRQSSEKSKSDSVKIIKSPVKPEKVSVENINDNAVMMHDDHPSLNISTSFHDTSDEEPENTVVDKSSLKVPEEGSNTFQRTLIAQGFDKSEAKDLQMKFVDKLEEKQQKLEEKNEKEAEVAEKKVENIEVDRKKELDLSKAESESENEEEEDECEFAFADALEKNFFTFEEPADFVAPKRDESKKIVKLCAPSKLQIDGKSIKIDFTEMMDIFSLEPTKVQESDEKSLQKEESKEAIKTSEPNILAKEISIDKILSMIHGQN